MIYYFLPSKYPLQWLPQPLFVIWRTFIACYLFSWMVTDIVLKSSDTGIKWLILYSNLAFIILTITYLILGILTLLYTIQKYCCTTEDRKVLCLSSSPGDYDTPPEVYDHDYVSFVEKIAWFLWTTAISSAPSAVTGFHVANLLNSYNETTAADYSSIHLNGVNLVIIFLDVILSRMPLQLLHFPWAGMFNVLYVVFTAVYYAAGGKGLPLEGSGDVYIHEALNYADFPGESAGWALLLGLNAFIVHFLWWIVILVRDLLCKMISCCNSDISKPSQIV